MDARPPQRLRHAAFILVAALAFGLCQGDRLLASGLPEREETGPFPKTGLFSVSASDQTGPAGTADDPAIWVHPTDPSLSVVIGTNKNTTSGGLHVFDLNGTQLQFVPGGKHNNVDVRYGFMLGGVSVDLVSVCDRNNDQIDIYTIDPATRQLTQVGTIQAGIEVYGYAMYHSRATGKFYGIVASGKGVEQWQLVDLGNGSVGGVRVRTFPAGNLIEGIAADDESGDLYLAEEDYAIYKYGAEPGDPTNVRVTVDVVGSATQLVADIEGLAIYHRRNGLGYLIASSQGNDRFTVYHSEGNNDYLGTFEVPDARNTDGIEVINMALGPLYPQGMFVAQNRDRDFAMVRWQDIANALGLAIDTQGYDVRGGSGCTGVASVSVSPASASVEVGATVQLNATPMDGSSTPLSGCVVTWSSDAAVVTVGANGLVTGVNVGGPATITATSGSVSGTSAITVVASSNVAPVVTAVSIPAGVPEGASVSLSATFTDQNAGDTHTATIDWGDGSVQAGTVNEGNKTVSGSHAYADNGTYTVVVTVNDNRGGMGQATATATVTNVAPTAAAGGPYSGFAGTAITFRGGATDPGTADVLTFEWDFNYNAGTFDVEATGQTVLHVYPQAGSYTVALRVRDDDGGSAVSTAGVTVVNRPSVVLYFSLSSSATLGGVSIANEDIVAFDGTNFSLYFDGSDVGLGSAAIDALAVISPTEILLSFTSALSVPGVAGTVDDSDIVKFTATSLGANTAGTFTLYFDGSDVGLTTSDEDVDAIELLPDGRLLLSTTGSFTVPGVSGEDEDLVAFTPTSLGEVTAGTWAMYFDGSDVGLSTSSDEDVDAVAIDATGKIYLSTVGAFSVSGVSGADEDVFVFTPTQLGGTTTGTFSSVLFFHGSVYGLGSNDIVAIDLP